MTSNEAASAWALAGGARPPRLPKGITLPTDRMLVMGILNVTPDSFSDGGRFFDPGAAYEHAVQMVEAGADLVDLGGESTRPNSQRISEEEEWERIGATIQRLTQAGIVVSVDTLHAITARRAADAGAAIINDVSGGRWDPQMNAAVPKPRAPTSSSTIVRFPECPKNPLITGTNPLPLRCVSAWQARFGTLSRPVLSLSASSSTPDWVSHSITNNAGLSSRRSGFLRSLGTLFL